MPNNQTALHWKRNAGFFIAGQFVSMFGSMLVQYAITWHITLTLRSGGLMAVFTGAALLPMVLISPVAGVWADRYNRKLLVNLSDGAIAVVTLTVALLYRSGLENIWLLLAAVIARSLGQGVQQPAVNALIPQIVPAEHLTRFNGLQSAAQSVTMFAAPMAGAAMLTFMPLETIFFIDVFTAIAGISVVFFFVKVLNPPTEKTGENTARAYLQEMRAGLRYITATPWMKTLFIALAVFNVLIAPAAMLTPLQVTRSFGEDIWRLMAVEVTFSLGMMLGGITIAIWCGFRNKMHTMIMAWFIFGITTALLGVVSHFWVYLAIMLLTGVTVPIFNTPFMSILQSKVNPDMMGRVMSAITMVNGLALPLGMACFGPLADAFPIEWLMLATGVVLVLSGFVLTRRQELLTLGTPEPDARPTTEAKT